MSRNKPVHVQMVARRREGLSEIEIKKFFRKCKKQGITDEYLRKQDMLLRDRRKRQRKEEKMLS
jgi:hypothetical protein